ncbi:MAG: hypothetical protein C4291_14480 [Candidatus Dadabacteria bacterium]
MAQVQTRAEQELFRAIKDFSMFFPRSSVNVSGNTIRVEIKLQDILEALRKYAFAGMPVASIEVQGDSIVVVVEVK